MDRVYSSNRYKLNARRMQEEFVGNNRRSLVCSYLSILRSVDQSRFRYQAHAHTEQRKHRRANQIRDTRVKTLPVSSNEKKREKKEESLVQIDLALRTTRPKSFPSSSHFFFFFFSRKDYNLKNDLALISYAARCSRPVPVMSIQCVASRDTNARGVCLPMRRLDSSSPIRVALLSKKS